MSHGIEYLHSHSALERDLKMPKWIVLVDVKYVNMFAGANVSLFQHHGMKYYRVPIMSFVKAGGIFKNLSS